MARIRAKDTAPELVVRRFIHSAGLRYRLHARGLPGKPDLVFPGRKACLFVHGCFWHGCPRCVDGTRAVKSNARYWNAKIEGNRNRDARHASSLTVEGWHVFVVWECEVRDQKRLRDLVGAIETLPTKPPRTR